MISYPLNDLNESVSRHGRAINRKSLIEKIARNLRGIWYFEDVSKRLMILIFRAINMD